MACFSAALREFVVDGGVASNGTTRIQIEACFWTPQTLRLSRKGIVSAGRSRWEALPVGS